MSETTKRGFSMLGFGAAACVACCAGPFLAFLGGLGVAGLLSTVVIGGAGLAITIAAATAYLVVGRRRTSCAGPETIVPVNAPSRRTPQITEVP